MARFGFPAMLLTCSVLVGACSKGSSSKELVNETQRNGDKIVLALGKFYADKGRYPSDLRQLVPDYLTIVLQPTIGTRQWEYYSGGENFTLYFSAGSSGDEYHISNLKRNWALVDKRF